MTTTTMMTTTMTMVTKPPISRTVTFSSISPTILLIATMLQPDHNHNHNDGDDDHDDDDDDEHADEFDLELEQWAHACSQCQLALQEPALESL